MFLLFLGDTWSLERSTGTFTTNTRRDSKTDSVQLPQRRVSDFLFSYVFLQPCTAESWLEHKSDMLHRNSHVSWRKGMFCWNSVFQVWLFEIKKWKNVLFLPSHLSREWSSCLEVFLHNPIFAAFFFFPCVMRVTLSVCRTNQRLTDSQRKVCWVKRWPAAPVLKVNKFRFMHTFTFLLGKPFVWNAHKHEVAVICCIEPQFSFHLSFW